VTTEFRLTAPPAHDPGALAYWPTPAWCVDALLAVDPPRTTWIVEPSAGEGSIVEELADDYSVLAVEARAECEAALRGKAEAWAIADWLGFDPRDVLDAAPYSIVGNPPYNPAPIMLAHVRHCLEVGAQSVALLLPVTFLCSAERRAFNRLHPVAGYYPLARRPSCSEDGAVGLRDLAWYVWRSGPQRIEVIG